VSEDKVPRSDSEGLSGVKLLEFVREISGHAESEVLRVTRIYKLVAYCLTAIVLTGIVFTYKDATEFRRSTQAEMKEFRESAAKEIAEQKRLIKEEVMDQQKQLHDRQQSLFSQMQANLSQQVNSLGQKVERKVDEEFKTENITKLVNDKAQMRIDTIAGPLITDKISKQIQPKIDEADRNVHIIKGDIQAARDTLQNVQNTAAFLDVVTAAQNDDRQAFDKLKNWADDPTFNRQSDAKQVYVSIVDAYETPIGYTYNVPWNEGVDPLKLSFEDLCNEYSKLLPFEFRAGILQYIWNRKNFSKKQKMSLMIDVMKKDKSLKVVAEASKLFQIESKQNKKRLLVDLIFAWWERNKDTISDEPENETQGGK
jgi:hypothetical protein